MYKLGDELDFVMFILFCRGQFQYQSNVILGYYNN